jgi:hypothetical protein
MPFELDIPPEDRSVITSPRHQGRAIIHESRTMTSPRSSTCHKYEPDERFEA